MPYSIKTILHPYANSEGLQLVALQIIHNRVKLYPPTQIKVKADQFRKGLIINHPLKDKYNHIIKNKKIELEGRLLEAMKHQSDFTKSELQKILLGKENVSSLRFADFTHTYIDEMKNKLSQGRIRHYQSMVNKILVYDEKTSIAQINSTWLLKFENYLFSKGLASGTINTNIKMVKAIVRAAEAKGLISDYNFKGYKNPKVITAEPDFLNEEELQKFFAVARAINQPAHKLAAYYFLFSCFTGLRIGDAKRFNYQTHVIDDEIIVRATKNKKIVTIPLYTELSEVLDYIHDKPFTLSEQKARQYIKEISSLAGIKRRIKYHTSRHTCASRFLNKGLSLTEVAEILGDTESVSKIYSHIDKQQLSEKIKKVMG